MSDPGETYVPHVGWLSHEPGDDVALFLRQGHFEALEQAFLFLYLREGDRFLDCGAHVGLFSVLAGKLIGPSGAIAALEPNPANVGQLRRNLDNNRIPNVRIFEKAAWSNEGSLKFPKPLPGKSAYGVVQQPDFTEESISVPGTTLARVLDEMKWDRADFVKVDTEGAEREVLRGAEAAIREGGLPLVMIEFTENNLLRAGDSTEKLFRFVEDLGYQLHRFDAEKFRLERAVWTGPIWYENLFAVRDAAAINARLAEAPTERKRLACDLIARARAWAAASDNVSLELLRHQAESVPVYENFLREFQKAFDAIESNRSVKLAKKLHLLKLPRRPSISFAREADATGTAKAESPFTMEATLRHLRDRGFVPETILDVGAAQGYWTQLALYFFPAAKFHLLEPLPHHTDELKKLAAKHPNVSFTLAAAGDKTAEQYMNVTPDLHGSSLLSFQRERLPDDCVVKIETIDSLLAAGKFAPPRFVKMDVQGFELKALEGGKKLFDSAEVFILEASFYEFMPETPRVHEVIRYMTDRGFWLYDIGGYLRRPYGNDLAQIDLVFARKTSPLIDSNRWT
jgi:FkbM family methyltransferase